MKCFKFVTKGLKSPGNVTKISYSNFGKEIAVYASPRHEGQCARGLHVIPYRKNKIDWDNVIVSDKIIILDVNKEDIVYQNKYGTGKMRVKAATPLRLANKKEISHIRRLACKDPRLACSFAYYIDKCGKQNTRNAACKLPFYAYQYVLDVDKKPSNQTRKAACKSSNFAYLYAKYFDKRPRNDTRKAACKSVEDAYHYAIYVDKRKRQDTWRVVKGTVYESIYKEKLGSY